LLRASRLNGRGATCATKGADALSVGTSGIGGVARVLVSLARLHTLDVLRRLDLVLPNQGTGIHRLTPIDVPRILLLKKLRDLTRVHSI
jgi:hypothetical protein